MFRFWDRKSRSAKGSALPPELTQLSDEALIELLRKIFEEQNEVVRALFLVGYENFSVYYSVFLNAANSSKDYPASLEGMAAFLDSSHKKYSGSSTSDQANSRRFFYLYLAALLKIAHGRATANPALWDAIANVWVALLPGARALRRVVDSTGLWTADEVAFFGDVRTEDEGENYCLALMAPPEIRYHQVVTNWQERDLSPEIKSKLRSVDKLFRGD